MVRLLKQDWQRLSGGTICPAGSMPTFSLREHGATLSNTYQVIS
jgi:hypothetical protein